MRCDLTTRTRLSPPHSHLSNHTQPGNTYKQQKVWTTPSPLRSSSGSLRCTSRQRKDDAQQRRQTMRRPWTTFDGPRGGISSACLRGLPKHDFSALSAGPTLGGRATSTAFASAAGSLTTPTSSSTRSRRERQKRQGWPSGHGRECGERERDEERDEEREREGGRERGIKICREGEVTTHRNGNTAQGRGQRSRAKKRGSERAHGATRGKKPTSATRRNDRKRKEKASETQRQSSDKAKRTRGTPRQPSFKAPFAELPPGSECGGSEGTSASRPWLPTLLQQRYNDG